MEEAEQKLLNTSVIRDDDIEEFAIKLAEAVAQGSSMGTLPSISFSHTANGNGGYNYVAIVMGWSNPDAEVTTRDLRDNEEQP